MEHTMNCTMLPSEMINYISSFLTGLEQGSFRLVNRYISNCIPPFSTYYDELVSMVLNYAADMLHASILAGRAYGVSFTTIDFTSEVWGKLEVTFLRTTRRNMAIQSHPTWDITSSVPQCHYCHKSSYNSPYVTTHDTSPHPREINMFWDEDLEEFMCKSENYFVTIRLNGVKRTTFGTRDGVNFWSVVGKGVCSIKLVNVDYNGSDNNQVKIKTIRKAKKQIKESEIRAFYPRPLY